MPVTKIVHRAMRLSLALAAGLAAVVVVPAAAHAAPPASVTGWLQVWNLNTRHMTTDSVSNYKEFAYYITDDSRPGVFNCIIGTHWTWGGDRRIDFLFAKAYTASGTGTVDYGQAYDASSGLGTRAPKYSDHRGQGAALKYY